MYWKAKELSEIIRAVSKGYRSQSKGLSLTKNDTI